MAAKGIYHDLVKQTLINEGWQVTHDPYKIMLGRRRGFIDLGAERTLMAAERHNEKIAVEIKSFIGQSDLDDFEDALGQFLIYWKALQTIDHERKLYLAVPSGFYNRFFDDAFFIDVAHSFNVCMIVFNESQPYIEQWKK